MSKCPCGSGNDYKVCCEPIIKGLVKAPTAEKLMRARYSGYTKHEVDFIINSHHPKSRKDISRESIEEWSNNSEWAGIEILDVQKGSEADTSGLVEFKVHYTENRIKQYHHELSQFEKIDGEWFFKDGKIINNPVVRDSPKIGRNDPCPCGSGKKYKKCRG